MNIFSLFKRVAHVGVTADSGYYPQFYLRIIGAYQYMIFVTGDKSFSYFASAFRTHRDILQVGIVAAKPAGNRDCLVVAGVDPARFTVDHQWQGVDIGAF